MSNIVKEIIFGSGKNLLNLYEYLLSINSIIIFLFYLFKLLTIYSLLRNIIITIIIISFISFPGGSFYPEFLYFSSGRLLTVISFLFSYIIFQSYSSGIISSLLSDDSTLPFNDLVGLMDSGGYVIEYPSSVPLEHDLAVSKHFCYK